MNELEEYYLANYAGVGMPEFKDLTPEFKKDIEKSLGFAVWGLSNAISKFAYLFIKPLNNFLHKHFPEKPLK